MTRLAPPPLSPNCVSSRAKPTDWLHYIQPLTRTTLDHIRSVVTAMPRTEVIEQTDEYQFDQERSAAWFRGLN